MGPLIAIMSRVPFPGQTKTRLMPGLGGEACAKLQQAFLEDLITLLVDTVKLPACVFYTPRDQEQRLETIVAGRLPLVPQEGADLGARIASVIQWGFARGFNGVIVVGSDLPTLPAVILHAAVELLEDHDVILGPALDGGYYLVAARNYFPAIFEGISWGTDKVFAETMQRIADSGLKGAVLTDLNDIDTYDDLLDLCRELAEAAAKGHAYPRKTYIALAEIFSSPEGKAHVVNSRVGVRKC